METSKLAAAPVKLACGPEMVLLPVDKAVVVALPVETVTVERLVAVEDAVERLVAVEDAVERPVAVEDAMVVEKEVALTSSVVTLPVTVSVGTTTTG